MDQLNARREQIGASPPQVTITDYDKAMRSAVTRVYPDAKPQLCIFHINKNVVANVKKKWDKRAAAAVAASHAATNNSDDDSDDEDLEVVVKRLNRLAREEVKGTGDGLGPVPETIKHLRAGLYELWRHIVYTGTVDDFNNTYEKVKAFFSDQPALLTYLKDTYVSLAPQWAGCYIRKRLNFGHRTTSPVESINRYLKAFMVTGNSHIMEVVTQSFNMVAAMETNITQARKEQKNKIRFDYISQEWMGSARYNISWRGLEFVNREHRYMLGFITKLASRTQCTNSFTTQFGIPCRHKLLKRHRAGELILVKEDFHPF
jgi:hypothetical protein